MEDGIEQRSYEIPKNESVTCEYHAIFSDMVVVVLVNYSPLAKLYCVHYCCICS